MKIALVVPGGVDRSGEYRVIPALLALIKRLALHHDVHVFALAQEAVPGEWQIAGAHVHNIGSLSTRRRTVMAILRENRVAPFAVVHSIWSGACGMVAVVTAGVLRVPTIVHIAGGELVALPEIDYGGRLTWKGRLREALVLRAASVISAPSMPIVDSLAALELSAQRVPLGVDLDVWPPRAPTRRDIGEAARLIHVASLNRVKDQSTLLRAVALLASSGLDFHLDVAGEDTLHGEIQLLAENLGVAKYIRFHGFLAQQQLRPLVEMAHVMVISSRHEAGPMAMLEAAAVGVPTVGTAVGHIAEWSPSAAVAVAVGDFEALSSAVRRLLENEELRLRTAQAAFARATQEDANYTLACVQNLHRMVAVGG